MDYQKILSIANDKVGIQYPNIVEDIKECISSGSTGGEISSKVGSYLKKLKINNKHAYYILEKEIQLYLLDCKKHGLYII